MIRNILGRTNVGPVPDVFVSGDRGLMCIECCHQRMALHGYEEAVELHNGHVNRENSQQKLKERI